MALGRGLSSLIPNLKTTIPVFENKEVSTADLNKNNNSISKNGELWHIPISLIKANAYQPRKNFAHQDLEDLISSIKEHGILQPLLVTEKNDGTYELIAGERRLRAAQFIGLSTVPAVMKKVTGSAKLELALIENIQRQNLDPIEEAFAYERLIKEFSLTQEEVAKKVGKSRPFIANTLRLLSLPEEIQKAVGEGLITSTAARAILGITKPADQLKLFRKIVKDKSSVHTIEDSVAQKRLATQGFSRRDPVLVDYEQKLREKFGTKIKITKKGEKGTIVLDYYSEEELRRIIKELMR